MLRCMRKLTFTRLGVHTNRLAARLMAARDEINGAATEGWCVAAPGDLIGEQGSPPTAELGRETEKEIADGEGPTILSARPGVFVPSMRSAG